jgi:hypothetical protein
MADCKRCGKLVPKTYPDECFCGDADLEVRVVEYQRRIAELEDENELLSKVADVLCANICESTQETGVGQIHEYICDALKERLAARRAKEGDTWKAS